MSIFTRRHYVFLASVARDIVHKYATSECVGEMDAIEVLSNALASESPGFDRELFLRNVYGDPTSDSDGDSDFIEHSNRSISEP
jgi:hypothetical protein